MSTKMFMLGEVKAPADDNPDDPNGFFDVILSAPTLDRDGEVIDAKAFDPLPEHITFDIDHGMSVSTTVGSGAPSYLPDGRLRVQGTYSSIPRAQEVRTLVREKHIRTTSVAFMDAEREDKDGVPHIVKAELLNGAFVGISSNRDAVILTSKAFAERVAPMDEKATKAERTQAIHDMCVANGATCTPADKHAHTEPVVAPPVSTAPETPADTAGKSPASEVVEQARLRADLALLTD